MEIINSQLGSLAITVLDNAITRIDYLETEKQPSPKLSELTQTFKQQLQNYLENPLYQFTVPIKLIGTDFQKNVWNALCKIPPGKTKNYGELAKDLNSGPRAVGNACRKNPLPIIIPCHRVVAKNSLGGYAGDVDGHLLEIKKTLLSLENTVLQP